MLGRISNEDSERTPYLCFRMKNTSYIKAHRNSVFQFTGKDLSLKLNILPTLDFKFNCNTLRRPVMS